MKTRWGFLILSSIFFIYMLPSPVAAADQTSGIAQADKILLKADKIKDAILTLAKAHSINMLIFSLLGGLLVLLLGYLLGILNKNLGYGLIKTGLGLIILGVVSFVVCNHAENIAGNVVGLIKWILN